MFRIPDLHRPDAYKHQLLNLLVHRPHPAVHGVRRGEVEKVTLNPRERFEHVLGQVRLRPLQPLDHEAAATVDLMNRREHVAGVDRRERGWGIRLVHVLFSVTEDGHVVPSGDVSWFGL